MTESLENLYQRFWEARSFKDRWLALYKELYWYVIPDRDAFNVKFNYIDVGKPVTQQIWDNTAMLAAYQRANDLHGLMLPKDRRWGKFVMDEEVYAKGLIEQARPLMDEMSQRTLYFIEQSNLHRAVSGSNLDLVGGTGVLYVSSPSDRVPLYWSSVPAVATYIEYSTDDLVTTCWFAQKMTARAILQTFPKYNGAMRDRLIGVPNEEFTVNYGQIKYDEDHFYIYAVLDDDPFTVLFETMSSFQRIIIYRDRVRPGETEGRGIGIDMLPTIKDVNMITMYSRQNMAFKANPPMFYDADSYFNPNSVRQWAGAMIARNPQGRNPLEALEMPNYPEVIQWVQLLQQAIKDGFQVDPLGEVDAPVKSATEVSIRENRAQRTSTTDISRLINEQPKQIFEVSAKILNMRGLLVKSRQSIPGFNPKLLKFEFTSPLTDLQNQDDLNHFVTNMQIKQQFFGEGAALASSNLAEVNDFLTEKLNLPSKLFTTGQQLQQFISQMGQAQQQQGALPAPTTAPGQVQFPQQQGVSI